MALAGGSARVRAKVRAGERTGREGGYGCGPVNCCATRRRKASSPVTATVGTPPTRGEPSPRSAGASPVPDVEEPSAVLVRTWHGWSMRRALGAHHACDGRSVQVGDARDAGATNRIHGAKLYPAVVHAAEQAASTQHACACEVAPRSCPQASFTRAGARARAGTHAYIYARPQMYALHKRARTHARARDAHGWGAGITEIEAAQRFIGSRTKQYARTAQT